MKENLSVICLILLLLSLTGCNSCSSKTESDTSYLESSNSDNSALNENVKEDVPKEDGSSINISFKEMNGNTITLPVKLNGLGLDMIFDTGASTTSITLAEAQYLHEKGTLTEDDILDKMEYQTADGTISTGLRINLRSVSIGEKIQLYNIEAVVVQNQQAPLLLGQSIMKQFREISVDRANGIVKFYK